MAQRKSGIGSCKKYKITRLVFPFIQDLNISWVTATTEREPFKLNFAQIKKLALFYYALSPCDRILRKPCG